MANANRPVVNHPTKPLTEEQVRSLANCLQNAYRKECESDECRCITTEEHEKRLATK